MVSRFFVFDQGNVHLYRDDHSPGPSFAADWSESDLARVPSAQRQYPAHAVPGLREEGDCLRLYRQFQTESTTEDPVLNRDARNFSAWYRHVLLERQELVPEFTKAIRDVIDGFRGIHGEGWSDTQR